MDSQKDWHVVFTGCCTVAGAVLTYFVTAHFSSHQNDREVAALEQKLANTESSLTQRGESPTVHSNLSGTERSSLQKKISELQASLANEQREKEDTERRAAEFETTRAAQKEKINKLELKLSEVQSALDGANSRIASEDLQLKKLSSDAQNRLDRARTNFKAGRIRTFPAPDGSARTFMIVYDERGPDVLPPNLMARFKAGE
jgi:predicted RNase H-like nuclease (RuvC/YqgF family)